MNLNDILAQSGFDQILLSTGADTANTIGRQLGRMASTPSGDPMSKEVKVIKSALVSGFMTGYLKKEDGTINFSVLLLPIVIIVGLVVLIRKI